MYQQSLGLEAVRASIKIQNRWQKHHEIYLDFGHFSSGKAATYLMLYTNMHIRNLIVNFIYKYHDSHKEMDLRETPHFQQDYEYFLTTLGHEVNFFARKHHLEQCKHAYEDTFSIFELCDPLSSFN